MTTIDRSPAEAAAGGNDDVPARAEGVTLLGELDQSGYERPPALARRGDGQTVQLTPLLYLVLDAVDGRKGVDEIAEVVTQAMGRRVSGDNVRFLLDEKLRPLGLLTLPDGSQPEVKKGNPLLALRLRVVLASERITNAVTSPFRILFFPPVVLAVVVAFVGVTGWLLLGRGMAQSTREALYQPGILLLVFGLTVLSAGFHEFGHAAACRYGGATPGVMGAGIYLVWPAFYTDVTDAYRLSRGGRLRTDLGGLYFNAIFTLITAGVWAATGYEPLLLLIPLQLIQMLHQLMPFVRLDGYYLLSDLTGVPDLFARIKPTLKAAVPGQEPEPAAAALKPWVRVVVTLWILALVPLLGISLVMAAISAPRIIATAWDSLLVQFQLAGDAVDEGNWLGLADGIVSSIALALPALAVVYSLTRIAKKTATAAWKRTDGRPIGRSAVAFGGVALLAGLAWLWWPNGEYRPIQPGERGTVTDGLVVARDLSTGRPGLTEERQEELDGAPLRSEEEETPAQDPTTTTSTTTPATTSTTVTDDEDAPATTTTTERRASTTTTTTEASTTTSTSTSTSTTTTTTTTPETSP